MKARIQAALIFFMMLLTFFSARGTENKVLIPREKLFLPSENFSVQMSPDGTHTGWLHADGDSLMLLVRENSQSDEPRKLNVSGGIMNWQWSHANTLLAQSRNDSGIVYENITPSGAKNIFFTWKQPVRIIAVSPSRPGEVMISAPSDDPQKEGVYLVAIDERSASRKAPARLFATEGRSNFYFDFKLDLKAWTRPNNRYGHDLFVVNSGGDSLLASYPFDGSYFTGSPASGVCGISSHGDFMYFTDNSSRDISVLKKYDFKTGAVTTLAGSTPADLISGTATFDKNNVPTSIAYIFGNGRRLFFDESFKDKFTRLEKKGMGDPSIVTQDRQDRFWLVRFLGAGPIKYWLYDTDNGSLSHIVSEYPFLDDHTFARRSIFEVRTADSLILPCQLYLPRDSDKNGDRIPDKPLPTILYVHGGPWLGLYQNLWGINRNLQLLADRGYAVVNTEFRGAAAYGKSFHEKSFGEFGGAMHQDLLDIVRYLTDNRIADKNRIGIFGWSYGGYAAAYAAGKTPDVFRCAIDMYGVNDLEGFITELASPQWYEWVADLRTEEGRAKAKAHSPMTYVKDIRIPLLITHGGADRIVPPRQSDIFADTLAKLGKDIIYTVYPDEPHDFRQAQTWVSFWTYAEQFLSRHLGGKAEPADGNPDTANIRWVYGKEKAID